MKKLLVLLLALSVMFILHSVSLAEEEQPETFRSGDWEYTVQDDGTTEIYRYKGSDAFVEIPNQLEGRMVTGIGEGAISWNSSLTTVTIPDSVTSIENDAFSYCQALTTITISDSVTSIGVNPFVSCSKLKEIIVSPDHPYLATIDGVLFSKPDKRLVCYPCSYESETYEIPQGILEIGKFAFFYCSSLTNVTIPDSVTDIGENAFSLCFSLASITIPDSVTNIENGAFNLCSSLTSITIPDSVTKIGDSVFSNCSSLTTVTIPYGVISIGVNPFSACARLREIIVSPDHPYLATIDGVLFSKPDKRLVCYPCSYESETYEIPQGILVIEEDAFSCSSLTTVTIADSVTRIGDSAFSYCGSLTTIAIPDGVTSIGEFTFYDCSSLTTVVIPDSVTSIGERAFINCPSLTTITIPDSVTSIGEAAFKGCESLTVTVPRNSYAKQYCEEHRIKYTYPDANDWLND